MSSVFKGVTMFEQQDDLAKAYPILRQRIPLVVKKDDEFYIATTDDLLRQGVVQFMKPQ